MMSGRALALAAIVAASSVAAHAQTLPWPSTAPQAPGAAPWPTAAPAGPPPSMPAAPAPGGPMGPPGMTATQQECLSRFNELRDDVEKQAMGAKAASEKHATREQMCGLVTAYSSAEAKWIKYSDDNMAKCGIPKQAIDQIKGVHVHTADARKKLCAPGPAQAGPAAAPTLSDALGTSKLPSQETEKPKGRGGTMDTLTGNALNR